MLEASDRPEEKRQDAGHVEHGRREANRQEHRKGATAKRGTTAVGSAKGRVLDEHLAEWLRIVLEWPEDSDLLEVLRDEVTAALETKAFAEPMESSGT